MEQFVNSTAQTTLSATLANGATSMTVISATNFPISGTFRLAMIQPGSNPNTPVIEWIIVGAVSGNTFSSLTRGAEGSTQYAGTYPIGTTVVAVLTAGAIRQLQQDILGQVAAMFAGR